MNRLPPSIEWNPTNKLFRPVPPQVGARASEGRDSYSWITGNSETNPLPMIWHSQTVLHLKANSRSTIYYSEASLLIFHSICARIPPRIFTSLFVRPRSDSNRRSLISVASRLFGLR